MNSTTYIIECSLLILTAIAGWIASTRKISTQENISLRHRSLTSAGKAAFWIMLISILLSLVLTSMRESASQRREQQSKEYESLLLGKIDKQVKEIELMRELNVPVRKLIYRLTFKENAPELICSIQMWRKTSGFSLIRNQIRIALTDEMPVAHELSTYRDASHYKGFSEGEIVEANVLEKLPMQYHASKTKEYLETRLVPKEHITVEDLMLSNVLFTFYDKKNVSSIVLETIEQIQVYADISKDKVVICTYQPDHDSNLLEAVQSSDKETRIENDEYMLHKGTSMANPDGQLDIRISQKAFNIEQRVTALDNLHN